MENAGCTRDLLSQSTEGRMNSNHANTRTFEALLLWGNRRSLLWTKNTNVQVFKFSTLSIYHLNSIWILGFLGFILDFVAKYSWVPSKNLNKSKYWTVESLRAKAKVGQEAMVEGLLEKVWICWAHMRQMQFSEVERKRERMLRGTMWERTLGTIMNRA